MMLRALILLIALFSTSVAQASVKSPSANFSLGLSAETPSFAFRMSPLDSDINSRVNYKPNLATTSGWIGSAYGIGVRYLTQEKFTEKNVEDLGQTDYDDVRLGTSFGSKLRYRIEGHYTRYKGLYIENSSDVDPSFRGSERIQRDDIEIVTWGAEFYWVLKPEKFSQAAAFSNSAIQTSSGGSWILKADFDRSIFKAETAIIPSQVSADFGEDAGLVQGNFATVSALAGYGYAFVWNDFYISPKGLFGYGLQSRNFNLGSESRTGTDTVQKFNVALALGYNVESFFASLKFDVNQLVYKTESIEIVQSLEAFTFQLGVRFF